MVRTAIPLPIEDKRATFVESSKKVVSWIVCCWLVPAVTLVGFTSDVNICGEEESCIVDTEDFSRKVVAFDVLESMIVEAE